MNKVTIFLAILMSLFVSSLFAEECGDFPDKLAKCEPYKCQFKHPFTGEMLERKIVGIEGGKCFYVEQMPNGGKMECRYSQSQREAAAQYYKDTLSAQSLETQATLHPSTGKQEVKYKIDGKEVDNPLQDALSCGDCVISGYGLPER